VQWLRGSAEGEVVLRRRMEEVFLVAESVAESVVEDVVRSSLGGE
jgi:hypothetical protein